MTARPHGAQPEARVHRARKRHRQQTLLRLVAERELSTQEELVRALRGAGFRATQATVSRDVVELGLLKAPRDGAHVYAPPVASSGGGADRLRRFCEDYPVQAAVSGTMVVLRSLPGTANALAAAIDAARFTHVVGTLAGDDTVFIAVARERETRTVLERLAGFGVMAGQTGAMAGHPRGIAGPPGGIEGAQR